MSSLFPYKYDFAFSKIGEGEQRGEIPLVARLPLFLRILYSLTIAL
jgi:hypothetical protein